MARIPIAELPTPEIPLEIRRALRRVEIRLRLVGLAKGLGSFAKVVGIGLLVGSAVEFLFRPIGASRWICWSVWMAGGLIVLWGGALLPIVRRMSPTALAGLVEKALPELADRLTGSVALATETDRLHGSRDLANAHVRDGIAAAGLVDASRAVVASIAIRRLSVGLLVAAAAVLPAWIRPDPFRALLVRFATPWIDSEPISRFAFVVEPGDKTVAIGSDLKIRARLDHRFNLGGELPNEAKLEWTDAATGETKQLAMLAVGDGSASHRTFEVTLPRIEKNLSYAIRAASDRSGRHLVKAVAAPSVVALTVKVESPPYTKRPPSEQSDPKRLEVIEGSRLAFTITPSRPVSSIVLGWPKGKGEEAIAAALSVDRASASASVNAETAGSFSYSITLAGDEHGLTAPPETRRLVIRPDQPPVLQVQESSATNEAGADDTLGVAVAARDDFGIAAVEFQYQISRKDAAEGEAAETGTAPTKIAGLGTPRARGDLMMPLKPLKLKPGDIVRYMIRVADNRPAPKGPNVVWSEPYQLTIVEKAEPILARRDRMRRETVKNRLDKIKSDAIENRRETEQLRYAADAAKHQSKPWDKEHQDALISREAAAARVRDELRELADALALDPAFRDMARPTQQIANVEAEAGREQLDHAKKSENANDRLENLRRADARLGSVQNRLEELSRRFDALAKADADRQALRDLAAKEDALADKIADAGADDFDGLLAEQLENKRELDSLLARSPELRAGVLAEQAEHAAQIAEKAKALAERQREEARKTTELTKPNDNLKALAAEQRVIEDDARRLALDIDEPLAENGRGRLNVEPIRAAEEPIERGDIGAGRQKLEEAERELRRLGRDVEDVMVDRKALARRLLMRQTQLSQRVGETVRESKGKANLNNEEKAALGERLKPLAASQRAIAELVAGIRPEDPNHLKLAEEASRLTKAAAEPLVGVAPKDAEAKQIEARNALNRLADALPDQWRRQEPARRALEQTRRLGEEVFRDLNRVLAETAPRAGRPEDPVKRAADLSRGLEPVAAKLSEAVKLAGRINPDAAAEPQRSRVETRLKSLGKTIEAIRKQADAAGTPQPPRMLPDWKLVGPFPINAQPPFDPAKPVDLTKPMKGADGKPVTWKSVADGSRIDLAALLGPDKSRSAFAVTEIKSQERRHARLVFGADDTLTVWVNGKQVHQSQGNRTFKPDAVQVDVELQPGVNRVVARIGNQADRWEFGAAMTPPPPKEFRPDRLEALREAVPRVETEIRASVDRLSRKMSGQIPADDLAEELAAEAEAVDQGKSPIQRIEAAREQRRLATALRNLDVPDAALDQSEAVRLAERAADALYDAKSDAAPALKQAVDAARALSDRLTDRASDRREAEMLARAQRGLDEPDGTKSPSRRAEQQKAIADRAALLKPESNAAVEATREAMLATQREARIIPMPTDNTETPPKPSETRENAAKALEELARTMPAEATKPDPPKSSRLTSPDPELALKEEHSRRATDLARRQRRVREKLQALVGDRVEPQEQLRDEAAALGRDLAELRDQSRETSPRGHNQATQAADVMANLAPRVMEQGAAQLAEGKPREAKETQRRAAETLERAAQLAEDLAAALNADRDAARDPREGPTRNTLGEARSAIDDAARGLSEARRAGNMDGGDKGEALARARAQAPNARRAAESLRSAAQGRPDANLAENDGDARPDGTNPESRPIKAGTTDLTALQSAIEKQTGRKWGELPGHLRSEILQRAQGKHRSDYSRLIQLYFQEIAAEGSRETPP